MSAWEFGFRVMWIPRSQGELKEWERSLLFPKWHVRIGHLHIGVSLVR